MPPKRKRKAVGNALSAEKQNAKKLEKREKLKEAQTKIEHDKLYREIRYGKECLQRHEKQWRAMLISIAEPRMRQEMEYAIHHFERTVDNKDFEISLLMDEVRTADDQYNRSVRSHIDDIDRIIVLCYDQIAELWRESSKMISNLHRAATTERIDVMRIDAEHETYLKTMLYCLSENSREVGKLMRGDYLSKQEVEISRLKDIENRVKEDLMYDFDDVWVQAEDFMKKYQIELARRKAQFKELEENDEEMQETTKRSWQKCLQAWDTLKILKMQQDSTKLAQARQIAELTETKNYHDKVAKELKLKVRDERRIDNDNLTALTLMCNDVEDCLKQSAKRGEKLLSLSAICRKFETVHEKTLRFPDFSWHVPKMKYKELEVVDMLSAQANARNKVVQRRSESERGKEKEEEADNEEDELKIPELDMFWLRVGSIEASRVQLLEECAILRAENEHLRRKLFMYCECLNCEPQLQFLYDNPNFIN